MKTWLTELKRRNVFRVALFYLASAWLVLQVGDVVLGILDAPAATLRLIAVLLAVGFPIALLLAWVFEITPQGIRFEAETGAAAPDASQRRHGRWLDAGTVAVAALAASLLVWVHLGSVPRDSIPEPGTVASPAAATVADRSIVVLPFVNMSADDQDYFADGIAEELLNVLARIPELRVISRTSAFSFKGQNVDAPEIARRLNVAYILEGSLRRAGTRIRITAQLIDARSDTHLWSATYDRAFDDIFAIQDDIASAVVEQLKITLLARLPSARETNPRAYTLYLQARALADRSTAESYEEALALLEEVLTIDPQFVRALDAMSAVYANQAGRGYRPVAEGFALAREVALQALAMDPTYPGSHASLGWIAMTHDGDLEAAARHYQRALAIAPTALGPLSNAAVLLQSLGRLDAAIEVLEYVIARDPVNSGSHYNLAYYHLAAGRLDAAEASYRTALRMSPARIGAHYFLGQIQLFQNDPAAAMESMLAEPHPVLRQLGQVMALHALADVPAADAMLASVIDAHGKDWAYYIASVFAFRHEADAAFDWLARSVAYGSPGLAGIVVNPLFASMMEDPRWLPFLESIGKAPAQLDAVAFRVHLPS